MIGNLPYYITSQILFTLADHSASVRSAVVTMQWEVAQRLVAKPRTKDYGILSVVFQLYAAPRVAFKIPPSAFYPAPKVRARARARVCVCVCVSCTRVCGRVYKLQSMHGGRGDVGEGLVV